MIPAFALPTAPPVVTVDSILREMVDLRRLARRPDPWYRYVQSTSYDRASDDGRDPFANGDAGGFIRVEERGGRRERVMADVKGPGAMVRLWSANPTGTLRFYFDGETTPRLTADMKALLSGRNPLFPEPYAYVASQGANLYTPMPFAKGLKVTWEGPSDGAIYYAVGTREYAAGTKIVTYSPAPARLAASVAKALVAVPTRTKGNEGPIPAGGTLEADYETGVGGEIYDFTVRVDAKESPERLWADPAQAHNVLRRLRLRMSFDGETTVDVPLGDFFGAASAVSPYESLPISIAKDGTMLARWALPFRRKARIWIENGNDVPVTVSMGAQRRTALFTPGTYLFHARWHGQTRRTRPLYEYRFLDAKGEGRVVGVGLLVSNPVPEWWGEGDEKVYVDGETFPSLFGTGTEDYFGYAWSDPTPFARPYHAQPKTLNLGTLGQTQNLRFHVVDDIPFRRDVRFDMEAWHWKDTVATFATTAFWYALPGGSLPEAPDAANLLVPEAPLPKPVEGALEGEDLKWTLSGGLSETQGGFTQLSRQKQFWWREPKPGATATTTIRVPAAGRYELFANLGHARDYGRFRVEVNGVAGPEFDLFQDALEWRRSSLGTYDFPAGDATVRFVALAANPKSEANRNMLGVDYLLLEKKP